MTATEKPEEVSEAITTTTDVEVIEEQENTEDNKVNTQEQQDNWNTNNE